MSETPPAPPPAPAPQASADGAGGGPLTAGTATSAPAAALAAVAAAARSEAPAPSTITFAKLDLLSLLLKSTEQGFWFIDNQLLTTDANPAMCRMLRTTREAMLGRSIYDYVDEANAAIFRAHVVLRAQGVAEGYEIALRRSDGSLIDCYNNATPVLAADGRKMGAIGLFSDISKQKQAERELRLASEQLAQKSQVLAHTLDSLQQGVLSIDADGHINAYNAQVAQLLNLPLSLLQAPARFSDIINWQLEQGHYDEVIRERALRDLETMRQARSVSSTSALTRSTYRRATRDGRSIEVQSHNGADGGVVRTYTDITERMHNEAALVAAKEEAERANRAKSDFLSRMSHELRTPMNAILGFAQLLQADTEQPLSAVQSRHVEELLRGGQHLLELINEVLDLSRIEAGALQLALRPVPLQALVQDCVTLLRPMADQRRLQWDVLPLAIHGSIEGAAAQAADAHGLADPTRLKQVLLNLLSNAIKYNREGGLVHVSVRVEQAHARVLVRDEGAGLTAQQQARLFQAFERLGAQHSTVEGAGIGLALSKRLMELMHGEMGVHSEQGVGSSFWLRLPLAQAAPDPSVALPDISPGTTPTRLRQVLYIEDNEVNQLLMAGMLAQRPWIELSTALHPEPGLALASAIRPDLILLDIQLPDFDGYEVLRRLRALPATAATPVVAVSANAMNSDLEAARAAGFDDYLTKPVDMAQLLRVVDRMLG